MDLKANTAVDVLIGPFVDSTDGVTAETALTISQADVLLSKNGQALTQKNDATAAAHDANGYYNCELDATDTNTEGQLVIAVSESGALPVRHEFNVISEAAYDAKYNDGTGAVYRHGIIDSGTAQSATSTTLVLRSAAAFADDELIGSTIVITGGSAGVGQARVITDYVSSTDTATVDTWTTTPTGTITYAIFGTAPASTSNPIPADVVQISGDSTAADNLEAALDGTGGVTIEADITGDLSGSVGSVTGAVGSVTGNVGGNVTGTIGGLTATALADMFDTDSGTTYASAVAGSVVKEIADNAGGSSLTAAAIADAVWDEATTGHTTSGTFGEQVKTDIDAILVDTAEIGAAGAGLTEAGGTGDHLTALATQASVNTIDSNVDAILVDTGTTLPASLATIDGNVDSILVDTGTTLPATLATIDGNVDAILVDTGTTLDGKLDTIDTVVDAVKAKTDSLTFTNTGVVDSNITHVISDPVVSGSSKTTNWGGTE